MKTKARTRHVGGEWEVKGQDREKEKVAGREKGRQCGGAYSSHVAGAGLDAPLKHVHKC